MTKVNIEKHGRVTVLTLDAPPVNAIDVALLNDLEAAVHEIEGAPSVVITGANRAFSAGVDLKQLLDGGQEYAHRLLTAMTSSFGALYDFRGPVVAAVNGHAIAGGCALALATDLRLASGGLIGLNELSIGLPFPPVAFEIVRDALGDHAGRVIVDAELHQVADAKAVGLIDEIVPQEELLDTAFARAERFAKIPPSTYARTKTALRAPSRALWPLDGTQVLEELAAEWTSPELTARVKKVFTS